MSITKSKNEEASFKYIPLGKQVLKELKKTEAMQAKQKILEEEQNEVVPSYLREAYKRACEDRNEQEAAALARKIRGKLLSNSDKEMSLDRLGLETSSATKLIASLASIFNGAWAKYRQALRDLPEQKGFPFDVRFPAPPNEEIEEKQ